MIRVGLFCKKVWVWIGRRPLYCLFRCILHTSSCLQIDGNGSLLYFYFLPTHIWNIDMFGVLDDGLVEVGRVCKAKSFFETPRNKEQQGTQGRTNGIVYISKSSGQRRGVSLWVETCVVCFEKHTSDNFLKPKFTTTYGNLY